MLNSLDSSLIIGYIVLVLIIGYISSHKQTGADFMIANRNLGIWQFVATLTATFVGGTILVVYTAYIYEFGAGALFGFLGAGLGLVVFAYLAKKLRRQAHEHNFHTLADYFDYKFGKNARISMALVVGVLIVLTLLKQFIAGTSILSTISGWPYDSALIVTSLVILSYLLLGGFKSVVKTDIFQYALVLLLVTVVAVSAATNADVGIDDITRSDMSITLIISFFVYGFLTIWNASELWQRIYAAKSDKVVKRGLIVSAVFMLFIGLSIALIGLSVHAKFPNIDPSQAIVFGMMNLLPPAILSFGVVLLFAAIMSTADTHVFMLATNIAKDGIMQFKKRELTNEELMRYTRFGIVGIIIVITSLAYFFRSIIDVALITVGISMTIVPSIIFSFKKKLDPNAIIASISVGIFTVILLGLMNKITPESMVGVVLVSGIVLGIGQLINKKIQQT
ncbi:hypothetical protein CL632_02235 [bacterium]|jgi:Na+/proline symporter|nr:hypothetical protein [bacterium]MDP6571733.1 sodium:solute symporter family protein [Patescibacteria group bacterium]MDP6756418.1 sodium:solute symporter family protein [Patescibacteria group bacterium]|tara:strand:- start:8202 stop:9551 length:1350 start_codon:yes stop_codon:yes gene_type:complete